MPKGMGYGGKKKTRVTSAGQRSTPIAGAPQKGRAMTQETRVSPSKSQIPRRNEPPRTAQARMGLNIGTRVTSKQTRKPAMSGHKMPKSMKSGGMKYS